MKEPSAAAAPSVKKILISPQFAGLRLDVFLAKVKLAQTRSQALKLISQNQVSLNGSKQKASYSLKPGDRLQVSLPPKEEKGLLPYSFPLHILFEDEELLIVGKPAGLVVHPSPGHTKDTLVNILFHKKKLSPGSHPLRPGVVHRLDKEVSGLLILAKTKFAQDHLIQQFKERKVKREYWAICIRPPSPLKGAVETWLSRHPVNRKKFISLKNPQASSKRAITFYKLYRRHESGLCWLKCYLKTGRTHQIRAHLSSLSCPLAGDKVYGGRPAPPIKDLSLKQEIKKLSRIALHAHLLSFLHPQSEKQMIFKSPWPSDLKSLLKKLNF